MMASLCFPLDEVAGSSIDLDRAADYLELAALFAQDSTVTTSVLTNQADIASEDNNLDLDDEMQSAQEDVVSSTVERIVRRPEHTRTIGIPVPPRRGRRSSAM